MTRGVTPARHAADVLYRLTDVCERVTGDTVPFRRKVHPVSAGSTPAQPTATVTGPLSHTL